MLPRHIGFVSPFNAMMTSGMGYHAQYMYRDNSFFYGIVRVSGNYLGGVDASATLNLTLLKKEKEKNKDIYLHKVNAGSKTVKVYPASLPLSSRRTLNLSAGINYLQYLGGVEVWEEVDPGYENMSSIKYRGTGMTTLASSIGLEYEKTKSMLVVNNLREYYSYRSLRWYAHLIYGYLNKFKFYEESDPGYSYSVLTENTEEIIKELNVTVNKIGMRFGFQRFGNLKGNVGLVYGAELTFIPQYIVNAVPIETRSAIGDFTIHVGLTLGNSPWKVKK
jgi:hypothetical protein